MVFPQPFRSFFNNQKTRPGSGFVAKITSSGAVAWARNVGGNGYTEGYGAAVDHDGNVFVVGDYAYADLVSGTTTLTNPSPLNTDIFLVKYSLDGRGEPATAPTHAVQTWLRMLWGMRMRRDTSEAATLPLARSCSLILEAAMRS